MKTILYRSDFSPDVEEEKEYASRYLHCVESRVGLSNSIVVGRYSVLPYYKELERDLKSQGSRLINTYSEHNYIASFDWWGDVIKYTPNTWFYLESVPKDGGPFVVKGRTNSRKFEWNTHMFAKDWKAVLRVERELSQDGLIGDQGIVVREFVPLKVLEVGLNGLPFSNEWRFFYLGDQLLVHGFYWTASQFKGEMNDEGMEFAQEVANIIKDRTHFFVLDIAEKASGGWTLIEVNDGQMSGLSYCDPKTLYKNLARYV